MSAAVTAMVVAAFLVPLFILVGDLARDTAISGAERDAESLARVLSVLAVEAGFEEAADVIGEDRIAAVDGSVILPDGAVAGLPVPADEDLSAVSAGSSFVATVGGGVAVYVPVLGPGDRTAVVRVFVQDAELDDGVLQSRVTLAALGLVLVGIAAWVADRLGRTLVNPVNRLADAASRLGHGDLAVRVDPEGPPEIEEVGIELNRLADHIGRLLQAERESAADLAHRLRTPLTAARLSVEGLDDGHQKERLDRDLDELERTTDFIIREARRPVRREVEAWSDLATVTAARIEFWNPLAVEQDRPVAVSITDEPTQLALPRGDVEAVVDALIENVLAHTPDGTQLSITVERDRGDAVLAVEDAGPGVSGPSVVERGASGRSSTGLGLDIVRRTVEEAGGSLTIGESRALGGAGIEIRLPIEPLS